MLHRKARHRLTHSQPVSQVFACSSDPPPRSDRWSRHRTIISLRLFRSPPARSTKTSDGQRKRRPSRISCVAFVDGRAQGHAPLATHGKSGILRQLHFLLAGAAEVPRFIEQGGTSHTHHVVDGHTYGAKEVTKRRRRRNKAFSGRKPFTATRAVSSTSSSVWERRDASSPIA